MKEAYINTLTKLMRSHKDIITVTADMGFSVYENLQKEFPKRFYNTGVTEQASIGFCAGLALSGYRVFFYAQAAFATMRCFEQVRLDIGYNNLNVKIIGVNAGFSLNQLGVSHFAQEDVGLMRLIPGMTVLSPGDDYEMKWSLEQAEKLAGPVYIRFSKLGTKKINSAKSNLKLGYPTLISGKGKNAVMVTGGMLEIVSELVKQLAAKKINLSFYSLPTIKPINKKSLQKLFTMHKNIFVIEEHSIIGGLGSALAELSGETKEKTNIIRIGINDIFTGVTGSIPYLLDLNGLSTEKISTKILKVISS